MQNLSSMKEAKGDDFVNKIQQDKRGVYSMNPQFAEALRTPGSVKILSENIKKNLETFYDQLPAFTSTFENNIVKLTNGNITYTINTNLSDPSLEIESIYPVRVIQSVAGLKAIRSAVGEMKQRDTIGKVELDKQKREVVSKAMEQKGLPGKPGTGPLQNILEYADINRAPRGTGRRRRRKNRKTRRYRR